MVEQGRARGEEVERVPVLAPLHGLAHERQVRPGDGLVILVRRPEVGDVGAEGPGEARPGVSEVCPGTEGDPRQTHVLAVAERVGGEREVEDAAPQLRSVGTMVTKYHGRSCEPADSVRGPTR